MFLVLFFSKINSNVKSRTTPQVKFKIAILERISVLLERMTLETETMQSTNIAAPVDNLCNFIGPLKITCKMIDSFYQVSDNAAYYELDQVSAWSNQI